MTSVLLLEWSPIHISLMTGFLNPYNLLSNYLEALPIQHPGYHLICLSWDDCPRDLHFLLTQCSTVLPLAILTFTCGCVMHCYLWVAIANHFLVTCHYEAHHVALIVVYLKNRINTESPDA